MLKYNLGTLCTLTLTNYSRGCFWRYAIHNINNDNRLCSFFFSASSYGGWRLYKRDLKSLRPHFELSFDYLLLRFIFLLAIIFFLLFSAFRVNLHSGAELMDNFHKFDIRSSSPQFPWLILFRRSMEVKRFVIHRIWLGNFDRRRRSIFLKKAFCQPITKVNPKAGFAKYLLKVALNTRQQQKKKVNKAYNTCPHVCTSRLHNNWIWI